MRHEDLIAITEKEVSRLGVSVASKGFYYLVFAITLSVQIGMRKACLNKEIYDRIAELNEVSTESVEKCIRNSVTRSWERSREPYNEICGNDDKKPTNAEVISFISSRILLERSHGF